MQYIRLSELVEIKKISEEKNVGVFHIEGLYTGYGVTLGNSLRRVLLSSLPGAAVTQIKIKDVNHEFSTLPGMIEDIVEFTLNLKKVRFHFHADEPQTLLLKVKGEREIKASDIQKTPFVQVVNPEIKLATLTKKNAEIDMEITVEKGLGYIPSESRKLERLLVGTIVIDAVFSPVIRVSLGVENMRVGEMTNYDRLKIEIETDGTISPSEALHKASNILKDHFEKISLVEVSETKTAETEEKILKAKKSKK